MAHDSANEMSVDARTLLADIVSDGQLQRVVDIAERAANLIAGFSEKPGGMPLSEVLDWIERINADAVASLREDRPPDLALTGASGALLRGSGCACRRTDTAANGVRLGLASLVRQLKKPIDIGGDRR